MKIAVCGLISFTDNCGYNDDGKYNDMMDKIKYIFARGLFKSAITRFNPAYLINEIPREDVDGIIKEFQRECDEWVKNFPDNPLKVYVASSPYYNYDGLVRVDFFIEMEAPYLKYEDIISDYEAATNMETCFRHRDDTIACGGCSLIHNVCGYEGNMTKLCYQSFSKVRSLQKDYNESLQEED